MFQKRRLGNCWKYIKNYFLPLLESKITLTASVCAIRRCVRSAVRVATQCKDGLLSPDIDADNNNSQMSGCKPCYGVSGCQGWLTYSYMYMYMHGLLRNSSLMWHHFRASFVSRHGAFFIYSLDRSDGKFHASTQVSNHADISLIQRKGLRFLIICCLK